MIKFFTRQSLFIAFFLFSSMLIAQGGQKWSLAGNTASSSDFLGTTNSSSLIFKTNNLPRITMGADGSIVFHAFAQTP